MVRADSLTAECSFLDTMQGRIMQNTSPRVLTRLASGRRTSSRETRAAPAMIVPIWWAVRVVTVPLIGGAAVSNVNGVCRSGPFSPAPQLTYPTGPSKSLQILIYLTAPRPSTEALPLKSAPGLKRSLRRVFPDPFSPTISSADTSLAFSGTLCNTNDSQDLYRQYKA